MAFYDDQGAKVKALELVKSAIESGSFLGSAPWWNLSNPEQSGKEFGQCIGAAIASLAEELKKL
ncbi:hypothetical protein [Burkholderia stagnalis]|uniref:hypothetical protein n=1 Tax=Burkholderia stagnalis TaxID=1503054 RepID=UPI000A54906E|nr:hypothetical protein [Burkholderia stagnalis]